MVNREYDVKDMAKILGVSVQTVYKLARNGVLPANAHTFNRYGTPRRVWTQLQLDQWARED